MKKIIYLVAIAILVSGCAGADKLRAENRESMSKLTIGMTKQQVIDIMGNKTARVLGRIVNNPYRTEILQGKAKTFEVLYYYTEEQGWYDGIDDDALTPFVFDNSRLIGWGQSFLQNITTQYEIIP